MSRERVAGVLAQAEATEPGRRTGHAFAWKSGRASFSGQHRLPGGQGAANRRHNAVRRQGRQRSIRSTITILLVIPLISLIALWAYAAASTVGGAIAERNSDTINKDVGANNQELLLQLTVERAETFAWQSAPGRMSRAGLDAQRTRTDAGVAAFRAGVAASAGEESAAVQPEVTVLLGKLGQLGGIRAAVDARTVQPLAAFQAYNDIIDASFPFARSVLTNPVGSIAYYEQGEGVIDEGQALDFIGQEAALVGAALVSDGTMSAAEHQLFVQAVGNQRYLEQTAESPVYWQQSPDPFPRLFASGVYTDFKGMEDRIAAAGPGTRLPVSRAAWQSGVQSLESAFNSTFTVARSTTTSGLAHAGDVILLRLFLVGGGGLAAVIVSALLLLGFGTRITRELTGLRRAARSLADERLPSLVSRLRQGEEVDVAAEAPPLALPTRTREVTETADAFSAVQRTAVEAAVGQAQLRKAFSGVFRSLARRNQSLLQRQLRMLDEMEKGTHDPDALAQLFRLDHLTTRMRRQAEGLIILSGGSPGRGWRQPVPVIEVLRGAIGEVEDYIRVDMATDSPDFMHGAAVADVTHLLAELVENAASYSPPNTRIQVRGGRVAAGYVIEVEDRGLGIPADMMSLLNERLGEPPEFDLADSDQLGLFVVSRLAARHGVGVTLRMSAYGGTRAIVLLPAPLVVTEEEAVMLAARNAAPRALAGLDRSMDPASRRRPRPGRVPAASPLPAQAPAVVPAPALAPAEPEPGSADPDLPRRQPMTRIAPQLRDRPSREPGSGPARVRSPEQARSLLASIQQGSQSGRVAAGPADADGRGDSSHEGPDGRAGR